MPSVQCPTTNICALEQNKPYTINMEPLSTFFIIILVGLLSASLFRRIHFPWVIALIIGGIIIGPDGFDLLEPDSTAIFIGNLGLTFLMFMAGLETKFDSFKKAGKSSYFLAFFNGIIPFIVGALIGYILGYNLLTSVLIGTVFVSSSIAVVIPALEANNLFEVRIGRVVMTSSVIQDVASLLLLSILLQTVTPTASLPLYIFYPTILVAIVLLRYLIPRLRKILSDLTSPEEEVFQEELRSVVLILVGTVLVFELLGLHSIIGGFFAGLVLSDLITDKVLIGKIRAISYGIFIPTFFILIGVNTSVSALFSADNALYLTLLVVLGSITSKYASGYIGSRLVKFNKIQSEFYGSSSIPQLSTTLAVSYSANNLGLITDELNTAFIVLSVVSTFLGPILMSKFDVSKLKSDK